MQFHTCLDSEAVKRCVYRIVNSISYVYSYIYIIYTLYEACWHDNTAIGSNMIKSFTTS